MKLSEAMQIDKNQKADLKLHFSVFNILTQRINVNLISIKSNSIEVEDSHQDRETLDKKALLEA